MFDLGNSKLKSLPAIWKNCCFVLSASQPCGKVINLSATRFNKTSTFRMHCLAVALLTFKLSPIRMWMLPVAKYRNPTRSVKTGGSGMFLLVAGAPMFSKFIIKYTVPVLNLYR